MISTPGVKLPQTTQTQQENLILKFISFYQFNAITKFGANLLPIKLKKSNPPGFFHSFFLEKISLQLIYCIILFYSVWHNVGQTLYQRLMILFTLREKYHNALLPNYGF